MQLIKLPLKWSDPSFVNKKIATQLKDCLLQNGLICEDVGITFVGDHVQRNGEIAQSNLDHVYTCKSVSQRITSIKLIDNTSSDHHLVLVTYNPSKSQSNSNKKEYKKKITKRSMKNFNEEVWNAALQTKNWEALEEIEDQKGTV